jgi:hypothetical protein
VRLGVGLGGGVGHAKAFYISLGFEMQVSHMPLAMRCIRNGLLIGFEMQVSHMPLPMRLLFGLVFRLPNWSLFLPHGPKSADRNPKSYTLHPTSYTLHPTPSPYTLHPA